MGPWRRKALLLTVKKDDPEEEGTVGLCPKV